MQHSLCAPFSLLVPYYAWVHYETGYNVGPLKMYLKEKRTADSWHTSGIRKTSTKGAYAWHLTYPRGEITEWRHSAVSQDISFWAVFAMWFHGINPESCAPLRRWCCLAGGLSLPQRHMADKDGTGTGTDRGVVARVQLHILNKVMYQTSGWLTDWDIWWLSTILL